MKHGRFSMETSDDRLSQLEEPTGQYFKEEYDTDSKPRLTKEQLDMIFCGKRPDGMNFEEFKAMRKFVKNYTYNRKKGEVSFVAKTYGEKGKGKTFKKEKI